MFGKIFMFVFWGLDFFGFVFWLFGEEFLGFWGTGTVLIGKKKGEKVRKREKKEVEECPRPGIYKNKE